MRPVKHIAEDIAYSDLVANNGLRLELRDAIADALAEERDRGSVPVTKANAKIEIERRLSGLTDLLAIFFDADVDPRAWRQLLTYAPKDVMQQAVRETVG